MREAAAKLAVVCAAMKDGGGFGMCCFLRGGGGRENQQSSRPELVGKQEEPAAASRAGAAARGGEQGARQHASKRSAAADRCASRRSPWGGGTGEELPTRRDRCATRRSCTCTSDEAEICYSAADSGCLCPVASRPVEAESRTATTGRRWWRAPGRCSRAGTRSRQDPGGHRGGEEKKGWRRQMTCGAVCQ